jgi:queuine tRNA-ribosyltransferase
MPSASPPSPPFPAPETVRVATPHGVVEGPRFFPDATRGVVRAIDAADLEATGTETVMVNALHLTTQPGAEMISSVGGLHRFMGWPGPIVTDSGGFQIFSLLRESSRYGSVTDKGFVYRAGGGPKKRLFTPEKSIQQQMRFGADVLFCLDHCTHPEDPAKTQRESVERTVAWARRCRDEFDRRLDDGAVGDDSSRPRLFAVIQGGPDPELRRRCAESLLDIGFDGYGFGGWPIGEDGELVEMVHRVAEMVPAGVPIHGLGIGKPENLVAAHRAGYHTFDSSYPTRAARRRQLMAARGPWSSPLPESDFYDTLYLQDKKFYRDDAPVEEGCPCLACRRYGRAYLHHLFRIDEGVADRLATIHNLTFYARLMAALAHDGAGAPESVSGA